MSRCVLGVDFGTESARAVVLDIETGEVRGTAVAHYPHGVLDDALPDGTELGRDWALQDPDDWLLALERAGREAAAAADVKPQEVVGLGIDFTSCTVLPVRRDGTPLCRGEWRLKPHAWPKLWKHHAAQAQADRVNEVARLRDEEWLPRYGGQVSAEWLLPKALEILQESPEVYEEADLIVEGGDWVGWQLTGRFVRNACAAGFKALWHKRHGYPDAGYLAALHADLADFYAAHGAGVVAAPGTALGPLVNEWVGRLGLTQSTEVAVGMIDAHAGAVGAAVDEPGILYLATGTSTCHLLLADREVHVSGISGVVEDGLLPKWFGYEAGQPAVGDLFAWYVSHVGGSHAELSEQAASLPAGAHGLLAVDWWQGSRTPLVDADLGGILLGCTLDTSRAAVYRALIEATAFGTRLIADNYADAGLEVTRYRVGGGLTGNELLLQIYSDVLGAPIEVVRAEQPSARGAAILGAVAAGAYSAVEEAAVAMTPPATIAVSPDASASSTYDELYALYRELVETLGRDRGSVVKRLATLRRRTEGELEGIAR